MTSDQALAFWFGRVNYEQRSPRPSDLSLDRMHSLLELLDRPQDKFAIVHVAGTKGKGSTSAMLACVLKHAGLRTGLFTSPHLVRVEERIQIDGRAIDADELAAALAEVADAVARLERDAPAGPPVTFFEIATALGFLHFARRRVEIAVIEVGLGGRFDSTNVCQPLLSIITSISHDHTQILGTTLAKIAFEKSGIIKPSRPVISGARDREARAVIRQRAHNQQAPLQEIDSDFHYLHQPARMSADHTRLPHVQVKTQNRAWPALEIGLLGEHQAANASLVVVAVERLRNHGLDISDAAVAAGLANVHWPARLEIVGRRPWIILDCAHNRASAQALVDTLRTSFPTGKRDQEARRLLIFATNRDKDLAGMLQVLSPHFAHLYFTRFANPRHVPPEKLADFLPATRHPHTVCSTSADAWRQARAAAGPDDMICITGSVFLAGELRPMILDVANRATQPSAT